MWFTSLLLTSGFVLSAAAHGFIKEYIIDGVSYPGYDPYLDNPLPELNRTTAPPRIAYSISDNGPVYDVTHPNITCSYNPIRSAPPLVAPVTAGSNITLFYTPWPTNHFGSIFFYLARCPGDDCTNYYAPGEGAEWFKVAQWAKEEDGSNEWVTERFIAENSTWTVPVPRDIEQGEYVARMEMISLHAVGVPEYGAELYPHCFNLRIEGDGTRKPKGVKFPGAYQMEDKGLTYNETTGDTEYVFPGPPLYTEVEDEPVETESQG